MFSKFLNCLVCVFCLSLAVGCGGGGSNGGTGGGTATGGNSNTGGGSASGGASGTGASTGTGGGQTADCNVTGTFECGASRSPCNLKNEYCAVGDKDWEGALGYPWICTSLPASTGECKDCAWLLTKKGCFMGGTPTCTGSRQTGFTITCMY